MKKLISILIFTTFFALSTISASAATSKEGNTVTGTEVLSYVEQYVPKPEDMAQNGTEAEMAILIQTREIASQPKHGFTIVNYGAVLSEDGTTDGALPKPVSKRNPRKNSWKYISSVSSELYMTEFTNTNEECGVYQKKDEYDAFKEDVVYYGAIGLEGKKQIAAANVEGLKDKANAQYIHEDRDFFMYEIKNPESDELIGYMFIEKKRPSAKPLMERLK